MPDLRTAAASLRAVAQFRARVLAPRDSAAVARELERTDSDPEGVGIMTRKAELRLLRLDGVPLKASPLLKQELLALGGDAAQARGIADHSVRSTAVVLTATPAQYERLWPKLERQPFHLREVARAGKAALAGYTRRAPFTIRGLHRTLSLGPDCRAMGVVNVTPDSFSDGGRYLEPAAAVTRAQELISEGAALIDVGAESTRPGAAPVSARAELARLTPVLRKLHDRSSVPISVDTRRSEVAKEALALGADLVNDVGGLREAGMRRLLARTGAPVIAMHMRGTPRTMQQDTRYVELRDEVYGFLADAASTAVAEGVAPEAILIDPGLGFGKTPAQSLELLAHIGELRSLGFPVVVGASRKSMLGAALGGAPVTERAEAGIAAAVVAALGGAHLVRVHEVAPTVRALALVAALRRGSPPPQRAQRSPRSAGAAPTRQRRSRRAPKRPRSN
ncbi:MAG: dihydropteroate synthase [Thermoplasmata archaeon]|nr:dihydropteroate synthase [Thermoplasmata archaeon]